MIRAKLTKQKTDNKINKTKNSVFENTKYTKEKINQEKIEEETLRAKKKECNFHSHRD